MAAVITSLSPPRGRTGDTLTIVGTGFGSTGNAVTVGGQAATIGTESITQITVTVPAGIPTDDWAPVVVTSGLDASSATRYWWGKETVENLRAAFLLPFQHPGPLEDWGESTSADHKHDCEGKDVELLHELLQLIPTHLLQDPGDLVGRGSSVLGQVEAGDLHSLVALDSSGSGIKIRERALATLTWGRQLQSGEDTEVLLSANATADLGTSLGERQCSPQGGRLVVLWVLVGKNTGTDTLDRVRLLLDGVEAYDSGTGLGLDTDEVHVAPMWDAGEITDVQLITIGCTKDGTTGTLDLMAHLQVF